MDFDLDLRGFLKSKIDATSHNVESSLSELIHNSLDADARDIFILHNDYKNPLIIDNGSGMNKDNIDTLKKFYDSRQRTKNTIGSFNIGLKDCLLNLSGKWHIISKKSETEELVYCDFDSIKLKKYAYGGSYNNCIDSGYASPKHTKLYKNILDKLGLININNDMSYERFSGTIVFQYETDSDLDEDELENYQDSYKKLYNDLQLKLVKSDSNFKHGNYISIDLLDKCKLTSIENIDWLYWNHDYNNLEFQVIPYKTNKNINFKINYDSKNYKYYSSKNEFEPLKSKKDELGIINIQCNIISEDDYSLQEKYFKELGYTASINGIMIYRNNLSLYDYPNKWNNLYMNDRTERKYIRFRVSFQNNHDLDKLFNILPNKSLSYVKSKLDEIQKKWNNMKNIQYTSIVNIFKDLNQKSKLCKSIYNYYYNNLFDLLYIVFNKIKFNHNIYKKINYATNILKSIYNHDFKLLLNQFKYNFKLYMSFQNIYKKSINMIKYKQLCLFKYRYKCNQLEQFLDF